MIEAITYYIYPAGAFQAHHEDYGCPDPDCHDCDDCCSCGSDFPYNEEQSLSRLAEMISVRLRELHPGAHIQVSIDRAGFFAAQGPRVVCSGPWGGEGEDDAILRIAEVGAEIEEGDEWLWPPLSKPEPVPEPLDQDDISKLTAFDHGDLLLDEDDVLHYFTVENMDSVFGRGGHDLTQEALTRMAHTVIENRWHMKPPVGVWYDPEHPRVAVAIDLELFTIELRQIYNQDRYRYEVMAAGDDTPPVLAAATHDGLDETKREALLAVRRLLWGALDLVRPHLGVA